MLLTVTASTMIARFILWGKVGCHRVVVENREAAVSVGTTRGQRLDALQNRAVPAGLVLSSDRTPDLRPGLMNAVSGETGVR